MPSPDPVADREHSLRARSGVCYERKSYVKFEHNNPIEDVFGNVYETQFS